MDQDRRDFMKKTGAAGLVAIGAQACAVNPKSDTPDIDPEQAAKISRRAPAARELGEREDIVVGHIHRPGLLMRQVGLDLAIYDPNKAEVHLLNPTSAAIWRHVTGDRTLSSIYDMFLLANKNNKVAAEEVLGDIEATLGRFKKLGLVVPVGSKALLPSIHQRSLSTVITGRDLTVLPDEYLPPGMQTFTLGELAEIFDGRRNRPSEFLDTWLIGVLIEACCPSSSCCPFA